ncbi:MAG: peptidoglycan DD-metalloendopeptidase family protein [Candidatus Sericytochromatia bacterium]
MQTNFPQQTPIFPELDQLFDDIHSQWEAEIQDLNHRIPAAPSVIAPAIAPLTAPRSARPSRKPLFNPDQRNDRRAKRPSRSIGLPQHLLVGLKFPRGLSLPKPATLVKTAAVCATLAGAVSGYNLIQSATASAPTPKIRKVMAQNTQTKVAAFRKEVAEGNHFVVDSDKPIQYVVQDGDTVSKLANKFHVSPNTIIKNNDRKKLKADRMKPGTRLTILPMDGIAHPVEKGETIAELAKRYKKPVDEIIEVNDLDNPHMIVENQKLIIPNAADLRRRPVVKPRVASHKPTHKNGSTSAQAPSGNRLSWPSAGIVTSNYGWRWFRMHAGMDVAAPIGTPIRSAKEGRVVYSGWMGGYGYAVDVEHPNGVVTRYAHCSELHVRVGQAVQRGQVLAAMGSTGHSTGPHLHFEVHVNGEAVNPRNYF